MKTDKNDKERPLGLCLFNFRQVFIACLFSGVIFISVSKAHYFATSALIGFAVIFYFAVILEANNYLKKHEAEQTLSPEEENEN